MGKAKKKKDAADWENDVMAELEAMETGVEPVPTVEDDDKKKKKKKKGGDKANGASSEAASSAAGNGDDGAAATAAAAAADVGGAAAAAVADVGGAAAAASAGSESVAAAADESDDKKKKKKKKKGGDKGKSDDAKPDGAAASLSAAPEAAAPEAAAAAAAAASPAAEGAAAASESVAAEAAAASNAADGDDAGDGAAAEDDDSKKKKKKKKEKGKPAEDPKKKKGGKKPNAALLQKMQEALAESKRLEEEALAEERRQEELAEKARQMALDAKRKEEEARDRKKQKKKERIQNAKDKGTYLTKAEKERRRANQERLDALRAAGIDVPVSEPRVEEAKKTKVRYGTRVRKQKQAQPTAEEAEAQKEETEEAPVEDVDGAEEAAANGEDNEPELAWDALSDDEPAEESTVIVEAPSSKVAEARSKAAALAKATEEAQRQLDAATQEAADESDDDSDEDESSEEESESEESSDDDDLSSFERAENRIHRRKMRFKEKQEKCEEFRAPVVCVLGHVDTGKTKILDKLRHTNVQDGEAGGITQQIGATNVPLQAIEEQTKMCKEFVKFDLQLPGLLIIDTPGHESFSNLRSRGSSLCDIAVLVVDIMHGLEPQTIESLNLLKNRKTPFVVALNKIDRLFEWRRNPQSSVKNTIAKQKLNTRLEFEQRAKDIIVQFAEQGLNAAVSFENKEVKKVISLVPTSAISGDGMGDLIALLCELSQTNLRQQLSFTEDVQAQVLEVKSVPGLGMCLDVILVQGQLKEGQTIVLCGMDGAFHTNIRALHMPAPMKEFRVKGAFHAEKVVKAAQGVRVCGKDLEKTLAGTPLFVAHEQDEVEVLKSVQEATLKAALRSIKTEERGVYVQASTMGALEALLEFLKTSKIPYSGVAIGPVHKKDIMRSGVMLEHEAQYGVILAFDVKVEREAQDLADSMGVKIFTADIIYHLFDAFMAYREEYNKKKQAEFQQIAVFPCKLKTLDDCVFNKRDPIVIGVVIEEGSLRVGTPLCVPTKEFVYIGNVGSIEFNHKPLEVGKKGQEVCIKIDHVGGDAPKMIGRHFEPTDKIVSRISRESIDACKNYFRDTMTRADWVLVKELKKVFGIM